MTKSLLFSWLSILSGRQGSSFSAQRPLPAFPSIASLQPHNLRSKYHSSQETSQQRQNTHSLGDIYYHEKQWSICGGFGNLIGPHSESHLRIPHSQISWKALCQLWSVNNGLRTVTGEKILNWLNVESYKTFGQRDFIVCYKVDMGFWSQNVKLIWVFKLGII